MATETRTRRAPAPGRSSGQTFVWRVTAYSGVALIVLLAVHMVAHHFVVEAVGGLRTYEQVLRYVGHPVMFTVEAVFLVTVTTHAMLGLRSVLFDLTGSERHRAWIDRGLLVLAVLTVAYGLVLIGVLASRA
jgi:succinate dehydrogenase hydrophobic anchor subunit